MRDLKGKIVKLNPAAEYDGLVKGAEFRVEDNWKKMTGKSWMFSEGNPSCLIYAMRSAKGNLPTDDKVFYGKIGALGYLVHESEIAE